MAKKKSATIANAAKTAARATNRTPKKSSVAKTEARPLTDEQIGCVAGEIWQLLSAEGDQSLTAIKKTINAPTDLVSAAVGWLAREGKLEFAKRGRSVNLKLR